MGAICLDQAFKIGFSDLVLVKCSAQRPQAHHGFEVFFVLTLTKRGHKFIYFYLFSNALKFAFTNLILKLTIKLDRIKARKDRFVAY